ncbi:hypothetical protein [Streptomyces anulatus]|uniref:hypothetical protein n=1 Tax=Streptomyces anulatus TaxID=1892 RepID=UPI002F912C2A
MTAVLMRPGAADGLAPDVELLTVEASAYGPYVAQPVSALPGPYDARLFTRRTAELIVADLHRDRCGMRGEFDKEGGALKFTWTADHDGTGGTQVIRPDAAGRYLIGGLWQWDQWSDEVPATEGQHTFAQGAVEFRQDDASGTFPEPLIPLYRAGREEAQQVSAQVAPGPVVGA